MECHTDTQYHDNSDWHIAGLFIIIGASAAGVFLPIISQTTRLFSKHQLNVPIYFIQLAQFFGAGVIISTAFIHLFPSAANFLSDPCLGQFSTLYGAWSSLIAMTAILTMHTIEWWLIEAWATRINHQQPIECVGEEEEAVDVGENNASRMLMNMPMAAVSQVTTTNPVPSVFTSRVDTNSNMVAGSGFALSKYGNYAAAVQSRQHLALIQNQHRSRCLYSDPQFPLYASSGLWPTPPPMPSVVPQYYYPKAIHCQAKSTPELLRKYTLPIQNSTTAPTSKRTSESSTSGSGYAMVSEPLSVQRQKQKLQKTIRNKYPSMPRLPHLTNDGMPIAAGSMANKRHSMPRTIGSSSLTDPSVSSEGVTSPNQSQKLDTVFEADDCCDNVQASRTTVSETSAHFATAITSANHGKSSKRVSITATRASSSPHAVASPAGFASVNTGIPPTQSSNPNHQYYDMPGTAAASKEDQAEDSTTVNTQDSVVAANKNNKSLVFPVEIKQRALATYILELGVALYSVLIGLALGISGNSRDFIALLVAICFQQFFEGMALGTSLAELYWVKAQIMAQHREKQMQMEVDSAADVEVVESQTFPGVTASPNSTRTTSFSSSSADSRRPDTGEFGGYMLVDRPEHRDMYSKSRRTLTSMATSFTPEPWLVNPQLDGIADNTEETAEKSHTEIKVAGTEEDGRGRYLRPRSNPDRVPGWWKAWLSALAFTATCPVGIIIGLALKYIYEPQSRYALLFNGILQSICAGILIYVGLISLIVGGFNSAPIKDLSRMAQVALFLAVYAGAAVIAGIKIWT